MKETIFPWFTKPCLSAFEYLASDYGFSDPKIEQVGREQFICYKKGNRTISIAYEPGNFPIVEFYYPTQNIKDRRFPEIGKINFDFKKRKDNSEKDQSEYLRILANSIRVNETEFLKSEA